jgi:O-antigen/teichoic acid export membrane protein
MSRERYLKSFVSFSIGTWINALLAFITTPVITFLISPKEFGKASIYTLVYSVVLIVIRLGTEQSYVRFFYEFPENDRKKLLWICMWPGLWLLTAVSIVLIFLSRYVSKLIVGEYDNKIVFLLILSLFTGFLQVYNMYSIRMKQMGWRYSFIQIMSNLFNFGGVLAFSLIFARNFYSIVVGQIVANVGAFAIGVVFESDYWKPVKWQTDVLKKIVLYGIPFVPTFLLTWLFQSIDRLTLRAMTSFDEVGLYTAAFKVISALSLIQAGFTTFWVPIAYEQFQKSPEDKYLYKRMNEIISVLMFLFASLIVLGKDFIFLIVSKNYRSAAYIAPFLVLGPVMYSISETTVVGINFMKKTYWHFIISLFTSITNVMGNLLLVPLFGAKGAAISTGLSYVLFFGLRTKISTKLYPVDYELHKIYGTLVLLLIQCYFATMYKGLLVNMAVGVLTIFGIAMIYGKLLVSELKKTLIFFKKFVDRKRGV